MASFVKLICLIEENKKAQSLRGMASFVKLICLIVWLGVANSDHTKGGIAERLFEAPIYAAAEAIYDLLMKALEDAKQFCETKTVCYDDLGCFNNKKPYDNVACLVPEGPDFLKTKFLLYTRYGQSTPEEIHYSNQQTVSNSNYDSQRKTKFLIHGFTESSEEAWIKPVIEETLRKEAVNFIVVDWEMGARRSNYFQAVANCRIVGAEIALLVNKLGEWNGLKNSDVTLIGFSLGAQVAGYAGERLPGLGKIIGLDPAGPFFEGEDIRVRLDPGDAQNVAVLHTNGGTLTLGYLGHLPECGHVDFYPNGGSNQPGCGSPSEIALEVIRLMGFDVNVNELGDFLEKAKAVFANLEKLFDGENCNHARSLYLYTAALRDDTWGVDGFACDSYDSFSHGKCDAGGIIDFQNNDAHLYRGNAYLHTLDGNSGYIGTHFRIKITIGSDEPHGDIYATLIFGSGETQTIQLTKGEEIASKSSVAVVAVAQRHLLNEDVVKVDIRYEKSFFLWFWVHNSMDVKAVNVLNYDNRKSWWNCDNKEIDDEETKSFVMSTTRC